MADESVIAEYNIMSRVVSRREVLVGGSGVALLGGGPGWAAQARLYRFVYSAAAKTPFIAARRAVFPGATFQPGGRRHPPA